MTVVKYYPYRSAQLGGKRLIFDRDGEFGKFLEETVYKEVGFAMGRKVCPDNHVVFHCLDDDGQRFYVFIHDRVIMIGYHVIKCS